MLNLWGLMIDLADSCEKKESRSALRTISDGSLFKEQLLLGKKTYMLKKIWAEVSLNWSPVITH